MGGYLAALYAARHPETERLVLLAPAFDFAPRWRAKATEREMREGLEVFHYGENRMRRVHYGLIEDALTYPPVPEFSQPALIFHGRNDDTVPIEVSRAFALGHPNVRLIEMESGHELTDVLDEIVAEALPFLIDGLT